MEHTPGPPVPASRREALRREVGALRAREGRRIFDTTVHVGVPGGERDGFVVRAQDLPVLDDALRVDVWSRLLETADPSWRVAWLARSGGLELYEADHLWLSSALRGFAVHGRHLEAFYVLTREGWRDVRTGAQRRWKRLRL